MKPIILVDVDGVLLFWQTHAVKFCNEIGLCPKVAIMLQSRDVFVNPFQVAGVPMRELLVKYNESRHMEHLMAYSDARDFIEKYKNDFHIIAVTAMSSDPEILQMRQKNLDWAFGEGAIKGIMGCDVGASKAHCFELIRDKVKAEVVAFIDDMAHNIEDAIKVFPRAKMFHLIRDVRETAKVPCTLVSKMTQIDIEVSNAK